MRARDNPFSTSRVLKLRYRLPPDGMESLLSRLEQLRFHAAIVGPHGSGKTTLMQDLTPGLRARGFSVHYHHLGETRRRIDPEWRSDLAARVGPGDCLLLDGAEQLSSWDWWRFRRQFRRAGGMVLTTHGPGRLPTLATCKTSPGLLAELLRCLVSWPEEEIQSVAETFHARHQGNIRDALRALYDQEARMGTEPCGPRTA